MVLPQIRTKYQDLDRQQCLLGCKRPPHSGEVKSLIKLTKFHKEKGLFINKEDKEIGNLTP